MAFAFFGIKLSEDAENVWSTCRHTTAQSLTLEVRYLSLHTRTADSTRARAAEVLVHVNPGILAPDWLWRLRGRPIANVSGIQVKGAAMAKPTEAWWRFSGDTN